MKQILLTRNQIALVDDEDFETLNQNKWCSAWVANIKGYYAKRGKSIIKKKQSTLLMHREIMKMHGHDLTGKTIDHIDHNTLNNQKSNLRLCTYSENMMNRGKLKNNKIGLKGVSLQGKKWQAQIAIKGKIIPLGTFKTPELAHECYIKDCNKYHKEFANYK